MSLVSKIPAGSDRLHVVIYNAQAGRVRGPILNKLHRFFTKRSLAYIVTDLSYIDWDDIRNEIKSGRNVRFIAAGGDGTLRMVFEHLWQQELLDSVSVAFLPLGSANIVAFSFRLPFELYRALRKAVGGTERKVDLGLLNEKYIFFIAASFGTVSKFVTASRRGLKSRFGGWAYLMSAHRLLFGNYRKGMFTIQRTDTQEPDLHAHSMVVCNHLSIGDLRPLRGIAADDGHVHVITLHNRGPFGLARAAYNFFRSTINTPVFKHTPHTHACYTFKNFSGTVHLDGDEYTGIGDTIEIRVLPQVVRLVV